MPLLVFETFHHFPSTRRKQKRSPSHLFTFHKLIPVYVGDGCTPNHVRLRMSVIQVLFPSIAPYIFRLIQIMRNCWILELLYIYIYSDVFNRFPSPVFSLRTCPGLFYYVGASEKATIFDEKWTTYLSLSNLVMIYSFFLCLLSFSLFPNQSSSSLFILNRPQTSKELKYKAQKGWKSLAL